MSAKNGIRLTVAPIRSVDTAGFDTTYKTVGTPLNQQTRIVKFTNNSNVDAMISWNGTDDNEVLPAGSFVLIDVTTNRDAVENQLLIPEGTQFYAKGPTGIGFIYISTYYSF